MEGLADWAEFAVALGLFLGSHRIPAIAGLKGRLVSALGPAGYGLAFSALSLGLLVWVIAAAGGRRWCRFGNRRAGTAGW